MPQFRRTGYLVPSLGYVGFRRRKSNGLAAKNGERRYWIERGSLKVQNEAIGSTPARYGISNNQLQSSCGRT